MIEHRVVPNKRIKRVFAVTSLQSNAPANLVETELVSVIAREIAAKLVEFNKVSVAKDGDMIVYSSWIDVIVPETPEMPLRPIDG